MAKFFINRPIVRDGDFNPHGHRGISGDFSACPVLSSPTSFTPEIVVNATYPGADAQTIEQSQAATTIEQQMSGVDGMSYMYSTNATTMVR